MKKRIALLIALVLAVMAAGSVFASDVPADSPENPAESVEAGDEAPAEADPEKAVTEAALALFDDQLFYDTLEDLQGGKTIVNGTYSYAAAGLQTLLNQMGCYLTVDGLADDPTFNALAIVLKAFGMETVKKVDAQFYTKLLALALITNDLDDEYYDLLYEAYAEDYLYWKGCARYAQEYYYQAREAFEAAGYEDLAAGCVQDWPANGELWRSSSLQGADMELVFEVNSFDESEGMYFVIYTEDREPAAGLFLTGSGTVSTWLPGGNYRIKDATGSVWYGSKDSFGEYGNYELMTFYEFEEDEYLTWLGSGYVWTITINVTESDQNASDVGSYDTDWKHWGEG